MARQTRRPYMQETKKLIDNDVVFFVRHRFTIAEINAGATLLPATKGIKYRLVFAAAIAVGGAATGLTALTLLATLAAAARTLVSWAQANLAQSTMLREADTGATILADGASFTANDENTAITVGKTGGALATATHIDILVGYMADSV